MPTAWPSVTHQWPRHDRKTGRCGDEHWRVHGGQRHGGVAVDRAKFAHGRASSGVAPAVYRDAGQLKAGKPDRLLGDQRTVVPSGQNKRTKNMLGLVASGRSIKTRREG
jgi:hypothetical protein